mmetsp:Transcript_60552/g.89840  ORF Transcript_60552/g.89840 Transcript_60552/m.89840 type:complete len:129 (+) Transcript_60552:87-473(+)
MSDHCEEQEMEAEALAAIFDTSFEVISSSQPFEWSVKLVPVDCGGDEEEEEKQNHVAVKLISKIPLDYPEESLPELDIEVIKVCAGSGTEYFVVVHGGTPERFYIRKRFVSGFIMLCPKPQLQGTASF